MSAETHFVHYQTRCRRSKHHRQDHSRFEEQGLQIVAAKMLRLTHEQAEIFTPCTRTSFLSRTHRLHDLRPRDGQVLKAKTPSPGIAEIMGATDPKKAAPGTIRADFAESVTQNAGMV